MDYWCLSPQELYDKLSSSEKGLASKEADVRLAREGRNEIEPPDKKTPLRLFISQFQNPLIYVLIAATGIAAALGETTEAAIIFAIVFLNAILGFVQEYRSEKALEDLRKYVSMKAHVCRDGQIIQIDTRDIVRGDLILVSIGDIVPADARLLEVHELETNESVLSGESLPVQKSAGAVEAKRAAPHELSNTVFMGSTVTAGAGKAIVVETGKATFFGASAASLRQIEPQTEFERSIRQFGDMLLKVILVMMVFVFTANVVLGHGLLDTFLFALAIAVGITPELLPVIITIGLSHGARRLVKKHVAVKRLQAIEDLGNIEVLCADKTGTLTENAVTVIKYLDMEGQEQKDILTFSLLCNEAIVNNGRISGGTIDSAIWSYAIKNADLRKLKEYREIEKIAFDYDRRRMSVVVDSGNGRVMITKGAPEAMFSVCTEVRVGGKDQHITTRMTKIREMFENFGKEGYRVIAVASKAIDAKDDYTKKDEKNLTFLGFIILLDPPKKDAQFALEHFQRLGVETYILTGDGPLVTAEICKRVGIKNRGGRIIVGSEIDGKTGKELERFVGGYNIYARLTPGNKLAIVNALRESGKIVGFIGDGINDAPALKAADVGISVSNGADIAKDAADVVLMRKSLNVIADGISEGRRTFTNIIKYINNTVSANFGNMFTLAAASIVLPFIPLLPSQILLNNLLSDAPLLAVSTDNVDRNNLKRPSRWNIHLISKFMVFFGLISSIFDFVTILAIIFIFGADAAVFRTIWFLESLLSEIFVVFAIRTSKPFYKSIPSRLLIITTIASAMIAIGIIYSPAAPYFEFAALSPEIILMVFGIVITYVAIVEVAKGYFHAKYPA